MTIDRIKLAVEAFYCYGYGCQIDVMGFFASNKIKIEIYGDPQSYLELASRAFEDKTRKIVITKFLLGLFSSSEQVTISCGTRVSKIPKNLDT